MDNYGGKEGTRRERVGGRKSVDATKKSASGLDGLKKGRRKEGAVDSYVYGRRGDAKFEGSISQAEMKTSIGEKRSLSADTAQAERDRSPTLCTADLSIFQNAWNV